MNQLAILELLNDKQMKVPNELKNALISSLDNAPFSKKNVCHLT